MTIEADIRSLEPGALVELFVLDASALGGALTYFHAGTNGLRTAVVWQGNTYTPLPVEAEGFEFSSGGQLPRPVLKVANFGGGISVLLRDYGDLIGAKVTRKRTLARYLDAVNFPGGVNPSADPDAAMADDVFFVDRKASENKLEVSFELAAAFDVAGVMLPRRPMTQQYCTWRYRVMDGASACPYAGTAYFREDDTPTAVAGQDVCGKRLSSCRARFGSTAALPFGGFPGIGLTR